CFVLTCDKIYKTTNGGGIDTSDLAVSIVIPNDILIYPNPTTGIVSIFGVNSYFEMPQLVNLFGEKIYYDILNSEGETITINLASLPSGIYYLLNSKNQSTKILKI
ncbi:MAG TPA: T9SS type A sorting domain-containing protein, partial [Chitinophagales bacterium]|nr:T9SS type A sorting domain-containing protein [Chitinophagales bacterium]